jgi:hypothetical protein
MSAGKWIVETVVVPALAVALLRGIGHWRWTRLTQGLLDRLETARERVEPPTIDEAQLAALPPAVQRFFRAALKPGAPMVAAATVEHAGSFDMGEAAAQWKPFTSRQRIVTRRPGSF